MSGEQQWRTQDGELIAYSQMRTSHLFYALRMIWNHTAPEPMQIDGGRYIGPQFWSAASRRRKVEAIIAELATRKPLPRWMLLQLEQMRGANLKRLR